MESFRALYSRFKKIYKDYLDEEGNVDAFKCAAVLEKLSEEILPALDGLGPQKAGVETLRLFILGAVAADGRFGEDELDFCGLLLRGFFAGKDLRSVNEELKDLNPERLKNIADDAVDLLGVISDGLKEKIVLVCMIICGIDGKVTQREKRWIKKLIAE